MKVHCTHLSDTTYKCHQNMQERPTCDNIKCVVIPVGMMIGGATALAGVGGVIKAIDDTVKTYRKLQVTDNTGTPKWSQLNTWEKVNYMVVTPIKGIGFGLTCFILGATLTQFAVTAAREDMSEYASCRKQLAEWEQTTTYMFDTPPQSPMR